MPASNSGLSYGISTAKSSFAQKVRKNGMQVFRGQSKKLHSQLHKNLVVKGATKSVYGIIKYRDRYYLYAYITGEKVIYHDQRIQIPDRVMREMHAACGERFYGRITNDSMFCKQAGIDLESLKPLEFELEHQKRKQLIGRFKRHWLIDRSLMFDLDPDKPQSVKKAQKDVEL